MSRNLPLLLLLLPLAACVDNSGGPPPDGESMSFEVLPRPDFFCGLWSNSAHLLREESDVDDLLAVCPETDFDGAEVDDRGLRDEVAALAEGEALIFVTVGLGGCLGEHWIADVMADGSVARPWLMQADSAYGRAQAACPADLGEADELIRLSNAAAIESVELHAGTFNPELPGAPERPDVAM